MLKAELAANRQNLKGSGTPSESERTARGMRKIQKTQANGRDYKPHRVASSAYIPSQAAGVPSGDRVALQANPPSICVLAASAN